MKYLTGGLLVAALFLGTALVPASAGSCAAPVVRSVVKQQFVQQGVVATPVVAQQVVVAQFVAVPVAVPLYAVGYDPASYGVVEELKAIREELRKTREAMTAPPPGPATPEVLPQKDQPPMGKLEGTAPPHLQVLAHHCAACHTAPKHKGSVEIFLENGALNPAVNRFRLWDAAESRTMPPDPKPKVHPDDVRVLRDWARGQN